MGVVPKVSIKKGHWEYTSLNGDPNQTGNLHYGHFRDRYLRATTTCALLLLGSCPACLLNGVG